MTRFKSASSSKRIAIAMVALLCFVQIPQSILAAVRLPAIFSDHAVLQRNMPVPVWGWAKPGEQIVVQIAGQEHKATADDNGKWTVTLEPLPVGEPLTLVVEGIEGRVGRKDLLVGDVWLCSGQSNMEWPVAASTNADLEIPAADHPHIRIVRVKGPGSQTTVEDFDGGWAVCSPETVRGFSAVGYFFGRELQQLVGVPIGLIDNSWGGSACDAWIRRDRLEGNPLYAAQLENWDRIAAEYDQAKAQADYEKNLAAWRERADAAKAEGKPEPPGRPYFNNPLIGNQRPANLYHARLGPILGYALRGAIWYQGETNAGRAYQYREMFPLLIQTWRDDWKQGDFPFYWVQLADFMAERAEPGDSAWAELREAQTLTQDRLPNTGQAVIIDLGEGADIHPRNKLEVGRRLARWALARDYGRDIVCQSPRYESMEKVGDTIIVKLKDVAGGLRTVDASEVQGFALAGEDRRWVWAQAKIAAPDKVAVRSDAVSDPVAVRYAWADNPVCNLYNNVGLPVTPFRSDDWPGVTINAR
jgi:sialate O-acetylesterase